MKMNLIKEEMDIIMLLNSYIKEETGNKSFIDIKDI